MKNKTSLAAFVAAITLAFPAIAEEEKRGFYIAPEIGQIKVKDYCSDARSLFTGVTSCSDSEIGFGLSGGWQFNDFFAIEAGGRFGSGFDISGVASGTAYKIDADYRSFSFGGRGKFPVGQHFFVTGKAGLHFWKVNADISASGLGSDSVSADGNDPYYGLGVGFNFNEKIGFLAEYTKYEGDSDSVDVISGNLVFNF